MAINGKQTVPIGGMNGIHVVMGHVTLVGGTVYANHNLSQVYGMNSHLVGGTGQWYPLYLDGTAGTTNYSVSRGTNSGHVLKSDSASDTNSYFVQFWGR